LPPETGRIETTMCGRFSFACGDRDLIEAEFSVRLPWSLSPRYNIAPTQEVLAVVEDETEGGRRVEALRWGLIPSWAQDAKIGNKLINARAETLFEKPSFREAARRRRCLVLADGFYEWRRLPDGRKTPVYVRLALKRPFALASLWERWEAPDGNRVKTCAIVTTEANELLRPIHDRMPVIVPRELRDLWLDPAVHDPEALAPVLKPYPAEELECYEASQRVNSPDYDGPECIAPLSRARRRL
jgi:putative SOS response-associated peptidase YedK